MHDAFAVAAPGLEDVVARELDALGVAEIAGDPGGVAFRADDAALVRANLHLRAASRVIVRAAEFTAKSFAELERKSASIPWARFVARGARVTLRVTCKKSRLYHSGAVWERLAKWLAAEVPGVDVVRTGLDDPDESTDGDTRQRDVAEPQLFIVRIAHDTCTISADSSGELLHRRGYRLATAKAPMRETLAAGSLLALGYDGSQPLIDPMCGAGTIPIEAALIARNIAPGLGRGFACERWPRFDAKAADRVRIEALRAQRPATPAAIVASDRDAGAIEATTENARRAGVLDSIAIHKRAISALESPGVEGGLLLCNPPYGTRVGDPTELRNLYSKFGAIVRRRLPDWRIAMVSGDRRLERHTALAFEDLLRFSNGGIPVRLVATPA